MTSPNSFRRKPGNAAELTRQLKDVVRGQFRLSDDDAIMISEIECQVPGCPPLETVIAFWCADGQRRHFKVFKPLADIVEADLPPWWMKDRMIYDDTITCSCC